VTYQLRVQELFGRRRKMDISDHNTSIENQEAGESLEKQQKKSIAKPKRPFPSRLLK
jgi:hypothetical protein